MPLFRLAKAKDFNKANSVLPSEMDDIEIRIHISVFLLLAVFRVSDVTGNPELGPAQAVILLVLAVAYALVLAYNVLIYYRP